MSWVSIETLRQTRTFRDAYERLDQGSRLGVDHALVKASRALKEFVLRQEKFHWRLLHRDDARALDTAVRTELALGAFRVTFANGYTRRSLPLTDAVDEAAEETDVRAASLVLRRLSRHNAFFEQVEPHKASAFHQVLDRLTRVHGMDVMRLGGVATDAALAIDVAIDALIDSPDMLHDQLIGIREGASEAIQKHCVEKNIPGWNAAALWVLALRGRCSVFGEEERTQAYSDFDEDLLL